MDGEEQERDAKLEARATQVVETSSQAAQEAEKTLAAFWTTLKQAKERIANAGVMGPEQLDRRDNGRN